MIEKTEAVVLRVEPFSDTSDIVTWLTERHGRISAIAKGSHRPKSPLLGQYDLFYTCELLFYAREHRGVQIVRECSPVATRTRFRDDWRAFSVASYFSGIVERCAPAGAPNRRLYDLVVAGLDFMAERGANVALLLWAELRLMDVLGFAPQLGRCAGCGRGLDTAGSARFFSVARGGVLCSKCASGSEGKGSPISSDALAILRSWQNAGEPRIAWNTRCTAGQTEEIKRNLDLFLRYHLDVESFRYEALQPDSQVFAHRLNS